MSCTDAVVLVVVTVVQADDEKDKGNDLYKKRKFDEVGCCCENSTKGMIDYLLVCWLVCWWMRSAVVKHPAAIDHCLFVVGDCRP